MAHETRQITVQRLSIQHGFKTVINVIARVTRDYVVDVVKDSVKHGNFSFYFRQT